MKAINFARIEDVNENFASGIESVKGYEKGTNRVVFKCKNGNTVVLYHEQDCCESVWLEDSDGLANDTNIFTGCEWCKVEEVKEYKEPLDIFDESYTRTFYKFTTNKGYDTMRWYGTSNGYYSEDMSFMIIEVEE